MAQSSTRGRAAVRTSRDLRHGRIRALNDQGRDRRTSGVLQTGLSRSSRPAGRAKRPNCTCNTSSGGLTTCVTSSWLRGDFRAERYACCTSGLACGESGGARLVRWSCALHAIVQTTWTNLTVTSHMKCFKLDVPRSAISASRQLRIV